MTDDITLSFRSARSLRRVKSIGDDRRKRIEGDFSTPSSPHLLVDLETGRTAFDRAPASGLRHEGGARRSHDRKRSDKSPLVEATSATVPLTTGRRALMGFSSVNTSRLLVAPLIAVTARAFRATWTRVLIIGELCARDYAWDD